MTRSLRRFATCLCLAAFAFAQATLAAFACPLRAPVDAHATVASAPDETCPGHATPVNRDGTPLCQPHCEGQTGVTGESTLPVPPLVLAPFPFVTPLDSQAAAISQVARASPDANAAAPPPLERYCRLLI